MVAMGGKKFTHPYIPNSVPQIKAEMLKEINATSADQLYAKMIPERLLLKREMNLPEPLMSELDLKRHVDQILSKNITTDQYTSFLGAGCWQHYVPKVCEVIANRSEFLTAYAGNSHSDLGRFQANFEFQSLICELLGMEVSGIPTYDWGAAAGNSIRMASRMTGRHEVVIPKNISPDRMMIIRNFCSSVMDSRRVEIKQVGYDQSSGRVDVSDLMSKVSDETACVYFENPNYLGVIEAEGREISEVAHEHGAEVIVGVDPISLGVLAAPSEYGADIACGEAQPLGIPMLAGGGSCGFIASRDEERYVAEYPLRLISITETTVEGEYGFGQALYERTSYMARENAKDWIGTTTALWGITAGVYLSLMGPQGMKQLGETVLQKSHYTAKILEENPKISIPYNSFFKEFPVTFQGKKVSTINHELLQHRIFGGKDISKEFPPLGQSALYCVTEMHSLEQIESLISALLEVLA